MDKPEQIISMTRMVWVNGVDDKTKNEAIDLLVDILREFHREQIALTSVIEGDKVGSREGGR